MPVSGLTFPDRFSVRVQSSHTGAVVTVQIRALIAAGAECQAEGHGDVSAGQKGLNLEDVPSY